MGCVSVVLADRNLEKLRSLTQLNSEDVKIVATCRNGGQCIQAIRELRPDLALVDIFIPGFSALEIVAAAAAEGLTTRVAVFLTASTEDRSFVFATAEGGFSVLRREKGEEYFVNFLRSVAADRRPWRLFMVGVDSSAREFARRLTDDSSLSILTDRERQIVSLVMKGLSNKGVGRRLGVSEGTIKVHLHHVYGKLAIGSRSALTALAIRAHHVQDDNENTGPLSV